MKDSKEKEILNQAQAEDSSVGSAADVEELMKKYDRESNVRPWEGIPAIVIKVLLAAFSVFMIYMNLFAVWDERIRRPLFLGIVILFVFILYPASKSGGKPQKVNRIPFYDIILAVAGSGCFFYFVINSQTIIKHGIRISQLEVWLGVIGILVLAECCRRVTGIPIIVVAGCFVLYAFFGAGKSLNIIIYNLFYTTEGVIGTPVGVCSTYIVLFIIFGAFLEATGISDFFIQCANSIAGSASGGPAKVAVISSALCGMVSGSSVGNTVTTGSVTIPMMKKTGYPGAFAGAVEAAASTGGQIMPPIMGAAAFLMDGASEGEETWAEGNLQGPASEGKTDPAEDLSAHSACGTRLPDHCGLYDEPCRDHSDLPLHRGQHVQQGTPHDPEEVPGCA